MSESPNPQYLYGEQGYALMLSPETTTAGTGPNGNPERDWFGSRMYVHHDPPPPPMPYPTSPFEQLYLLHLIMFVLKEKVEAYAEINTGGVRGQILQYICH